MAVRRHGLGLGNRREPARHLPVARKGRLIGLLGPGLENLPLPVGRLILLGLEGAGALGNLGRLRLLIAEPGLEGSGVHRAGHAHAGTGGTQESRGFPGSAEE